MLPKMKTSYRFLQYVAAHIVKKNLLKREDFSESLDRIVNVHRNLLFPSLWNR